MIEEAEVRMLDVVAAGKTPTPRYLTQTIAKGEKVVRWQDRQPFMPGPDPSSNLTATQQQTSGEIKDLCESIQKLRASKRGICLGYLRD